MPRLHVNIDHIATVRQARRAAVPDPVALASICESAGAEGITVHLREDRRHIQDHDVRELRARVTTLLNLECAVTDDRLAFACEVRPDEVCLVPESRIEVTTEGGLDVLAEPRRVADAVARLRSAKILVSLFVDADPAQIAAARASGADFVEIHTGAYANTRGAEQERELARLRAAAAAARGAGLRVNMGHGLDYENVAPVAAIEGVEDLNIGFAIVARAVVVGMERAVREMRAAIDRTTEIPRGAP